ncbi:MAG: acyl--CoA ligase [Magnetococcales bacterium]|nr:acyl--CoA ligase [Magnetococcales bacterium]
MGFDHDQEEKGVWGIAPRVLILPSTSWTTPFSGEPILESLRRHSHERREHRALVWADEGVIDYGGLWPLIEGVARGLMALGLNKGHRVALAMEGSRPSILYYLGLLRLGAVALPMDPGLTATQWRGRLQDLTPGLVIAPLTVLHSLEPSAGSDFARLDLSLATMESLLQKTGPLPDVPEPGDVVQILSTTGTTGTSKHVLLTLGNISAAAQQINQVMGLTGADVEVITLPLYHSFGLGRLRCGLVAGSCVHLLPGRFRPERLLKAVRAVEASVFAQVPSGIRLLLALGSRVAPWLAGVRLVEIGSAAMEIAEKERLTDLLPQARLWHHYGLTEASRSLFLEYHQARALGCLGAMGQPTPGVEVMLRSDQGTLASRGEGELMVRGPHVTPGYFNPTGSEAATGTWFGTGDLVRRDEQNYFYHLGRADDCINLGGFKVHPAEVESVLSACPGVGDVAVAASRDGGTPHLVAFIQPDPLCPFDERMAREWVAARLEPYKHPQYFTRVDILPRTSSGKLKRRELPIV